MTLRLLVAICLTHVWAQGLATEASPAAIVPGEVGAERHTLGIALHVPPALLYVIDPQGRRAGMDPNGPVSPTGGGRKINEMPNTGVESQNIASDEPETEGEGQATTMWNLGLYDVPAGTYIVVLKGLQLGETEVHVDAHRRGYVPPAIKTGMFVVPGIERRLQVQFDPENNLSVDVHRVVDRADLPRDVDAACRLGQIAPEGVCQSLRAKAEAAAKALKRGRTKAARGAVNAFLNELKAQGGKHVQEPALTILREEAEALLNPPPPMPKSKPKKAAKPKV